MGIKMNDSLEKRWLHAVIVGLCVIAAMAIAKVTLGADCGGQVFSVVKQVHQPHVVQQAIVDEHYVAPVSPVVNYFVGAPVRMEAMIAAELKSDPAWQEFQEFRALRSSAGNAAHSPPCDCEAATPPPTPPPGAFSQSALPALDSTCIKCHSPDVAKGGFAIGDRLEFGTKQAMADAVSSGSMPKGRTLTDAEKAVLLAEIWSHP
jgi:hypothetical protein